MRRGLVALVLALSACDTTIRSDLSSLPDAAPTGKCLEAEQHSDFVWIRDNVLLQSCALSGSCHKGTNPPGELDLTPTRAYVELVGTPSFELAGVQRVVPFHPERSFLMMKLGAYATPEPVDGGLMPLNNPPICSQEIEAVRRWILQGAPETPIDAGPGPD